MPTTAPTPCGWRSRRATAAAISRCATTWNTNCCPGRRSAAARGRAPCCKACRPTRRHPTLWPKTITGLPPTPKASIPRGTISRRRSIGHAKRWSGRPSRSTFWLRPGCGTGCTNCRNSSRKKRRANRPICSGKNPTDNLRARDRATHAKRQALSLPYSSAENPGTAPTSRLPPRSRIAAVSPLPVGSSSHRPQSYSRSALRKVKYRAAR